MRNRTSRRATASLLSAVFAMPCLVDGQRDHRRAELAASFKRSVAALSPSSKLIELMIGLPPCSLSAASITGVSVLSITSGAFTER